MEDGNISYPKSGSPQGGISLILANISLLKLKREATNGDWL